MPVLLKVIGKGVCRVGSAVFVRSSLEETDTDFQLCGIVVESFHNCFERFQGGWATCDLDILFSCLSEADQLTSFTDIPMGVRNPRSDIYRTVLGTICLAESRNDRQGVAF